MDCESMDCQKIKEAVIFVYVDDEEGREFLIALRSHVKKCPHCEQYLKRSERFINHTEQFIAIVRKTVRRRTAPPDLRDRILSRLSHRAEGGERRIIPVG